VTLSAHANSSRFAGWSGACSGLSDCTVTMDEARSVTAQFVDTLTITVELNRPTVTECFSTNPFFDPIVVPCGTFGSSSPKQVRLGTDYVHVDPSGTGPADCSRSSFDSCQYTFDAPVTFFDLTWVDTDDGTTLGQWSGCEVLSLGACEL